MAVDPFTTVFTSDFGGGPVTRNYWDQPGGSGSVWNTPLGSGCVWGISADADTIALRSITGIINSVDNYGNVMWVSQSASNPTASFSGINQAYDSPGSNGTGIPVSVTAHLVPGSYSAGPFPANTDQQYNFCDTVGSPNMYYCFDPVVIQSFAAGQGPFNTNQASVDDATSDRFGEDWENKISGSMTSVGLIRGYDIDPTRNPIVMPGTTLPAIQHVLRYVHSTSVYKANANPANVDYPNGPVNPDAWPLYYQDYQGTGIDYTGNLLFGTTVGIPIGVTMPGGLTNAGKQLWWTLQHYGAIPRDANNSGFQLSVDQDVSANTTWMTQANTDLATIVQYLCPLRNQHLGTTTRIGATDINGPGTRVDVGPPALAGAVIITPSPNDSVITLASGGSLTDAGGNTWLITSGGQVQVNGVVDTTTSSVIEMAYVNGTIWQENSALLWYGKTSPGATWSPAAGTTTSPLPAAPPAAPSAPVLTSGTITSTSANLSWTASTGTSVTYQVQYKQHSTLTWVSFGNAVTTLTATVTGLSAATTYDFQVIATNLGGSANSLTVTATTVSPSAVIPSAATALVITNLTGTSLTFSWSPSSVGTPPITYQPQYRIHPVVQQTVPAAVTGLLATSKTTISVTLSWTGSASGTTPITYQPQYRVSGQTAWVNFGAAISGSSITISGLLGGTSYNFQIVATNAAGSTPSTVLTASTTTLTQSADKTTVLAGSTAAIVDASLNSWTITTGGQVALNGVADTTTSAVIELAYVSGTVWQENSSGYWYGKTSPSAAWLPAAGTTTSPLAVVTGGGGGGGTPTGKFTVSNGQFIDPSGVVFVPKGINANPNSGVISGAANGTPLTSYFPNIGIVRLTVDSASYPSPNSLAPVVNVLTSLNIVALIENHMWPSGPPPNDTQYYNWYASLGAYFTDPFVWFGTSNEPSTSGVVADHIGVYNAIRGTGNTNIILFETDDTYPGVLGLDGDFPVDASSKSSYLNMTNVGFDPHWYTWIVPNGGQSNTNQAQVTAALNQYITDCKAMQSADGSMPFGFFEWGDSTDGTNVDPNWQQAVNAIINCGYGHAAWNWQSLGGGNPPGDTLIDGNGNLTNYGQQVANDIAAGTKAKRS